METKLTSGRGGVLALAERSFEQWRRSRGDRERIPERLWQMAIGAAAVSGVSATARRLRLNATIVKQLLAVSQLAWPEAVMVRLSLLTPRDQRVQILLEIGVAVSVAVLVRVGMVLWVQSVLAFPRIRHPVVVRILWRFSPRQFRISADLGR